MGDLSPLQAWDSPPPPLQPPSAPTTQGSGLRGSLPASNIQGWRPARHRAARKHPWESGDRAGGSSLPLLYPNSSEVHFQRYRRSRAPSWAPASPSLACQPSFHPLSFISSLPYLTHQASLTRGIHISISCLEPHPPRNPQAGSWPQLALLPPWHQPLLSPAAVRDLAHPEVWFALFTPSISFTETGTPGSVLFTATPSPQV